MRDCLSDERIQSEGLISLRNYITELYEDACFSEMKKDIAALKIKASDVQSVTLGINVNERFEAVSIGLVSVNKKPFKKSGIVSNFADAIANKDRIQDTADWDGDMHYQLIDREEKRGIIDYMKNEAGLLAVQSSFATDARAKSTIVNAMADGAMENSTFYLDTVVNKMAQFPREEAEGYSYQVRKCGNREYFRTGSGVHVLHQMCGIYRRSDGKRMCVQRSTACY